MGGLSHQIRLTEMLGISFPPTTVQSSNMGSMYLAGHSGWLQEGGGPGPLGHDGGGRQSNGDLAPGIEGSVEVVCIMIDVLTNLNRSIRSVFVVWVWEECKQEIKVFIFQNFVTKFEQVPTLGLCWWCKFSCEMNPSLKSRSLLTPSLSL